MWSGLVLAMLDSAVAVLLRLTFRDVADDYMAVTSGPRRDKVRRKYGKAREIVNRLIVIAFILAALCASAALCGIIRAVDSLFIHLLMAPNGINCVLLSVICERFGTDVCDSSGQRPLMWFRFAASFKRTIV